MQGIKEKILSAFFLVISILVISGSFFVIMNFVLIKNYEGIMENLLSQYQLIEKTQSITESFRNINKFVSLERINEFKDIKHNFENHLIKVDNQIEGQKNFAIYYGLRNTIVSLISDASAGVEMAHKGNILESNKYFNSVNEKNVFIKETTTNLLLEELKRLEEVQKNIYQIKELIQITAASLFIVVVLFSVLYAIKFSDKLIKPLLKLTKIAESIKKGNLNISLNEKDYQEYKEINTLSASFSTMINSLKDNITKLNQYLDVSGVFVMTFDFDYKIIGLNKKALQILNAQDSLEIIGKNWIENYVINEDKNKTQSLLDYFISSGNIEEKLENSIIDKNKNIKNIVWHFRILKNSKNKSRIILAAGLDITELSQAKDTINKLKELDDLKGEILNIATHELKTPLISIVGLSEVIKNNPKKIDKEYLEYINIINSEGQKLNHLIKSMLTVNRNDRGKIIVSIEEIDFKKLKSTLKSSLEMLCQRSESSLRIIDKTDLKIIKSDKERISQIIYNFVDNAVKYGPEKQEIVVQFEMEKKNNLKISVIDNGQGINKEKQKKLFQKFSQLEPSLSRSKDGMGLGLYICKQNIEALHGKIGVKSEEGKGSAFYIIFPIN